MAPVVLVRDRRSATALASIASVHAVHGLLGRLPTHGAVRQRADGTTESALDEQDTRAGTLSTRFIWIKKVVQ